MSVSNSHVSQTGVCHELMCAYPHTIWLCTWPTFARLTNGYALQRMGQPVRVAHNMVVRYGHNRTQCVLPTHVCHELMCVTNAPHTHNMAVRCAHNCTQYMLPTHMCHELMCVTNSPHTHNMAMRYAHNCIQYAYAKTSVSNSHVSRTHVCHELMYVTNSSVSRSHLCHEVMYVTNPCVCHELMCVTNSCVSRHDMVMRMLGPFMQGLYGYVVTYWLMTLNVCVCGGGQAYMVVYCTP